MGSNYGGLDGRGLIARPGLGRERARVLEDFGLVQRSVRCKRVNPPVSSDLRDREAYRTKVLDWAVARALRAGIMSEVRRIEYATEQVDQMMANYDARVIRDGLRRDAAFVCLEGVPVATSDVVSMSFDRWFTVQQMATMGLSMFDSVGRFIVLAHTGLYGIDLGRWSYRVVANAVVVQEASDGGPTLDQFDRNSVSAGNPVVTLEFYRHALTVSRNTRGFMISHSGGCACADEYIDTSRDWIQQVVVALSKTGEHLAHKTSQPWACPYELYVGAVSAVLGFPGHSFDEGSCYALLFPSACRFQAMKELGLWPTVAAVKEALAWIQESSMWAPDFSVVKSIDGKYHVTESGQLPEGLDDTCLIGGDDMGYVRSRLDELLQSMDSAPGPSALLVPTRPAHVRQRSDAGIVVEPMLPDAVSGDIPDVTSPVDYTYQPHCLHPGIRKRVESSVKFSRDVQVGVANSEWVDPADADEDQMRAQALALRLSSGASLAAPYLRSWAKCYKARVARPPPPRAKGIVITSGCQASEPVGTAMQLDRVAVASHLHGWVAKMAKLPRHRWINMVSDVAGTRFDFSGTGHFQCNGWTLEADATTLVPDVGMYLNVYTESAVEVVVWKPRRGSGRGLPDVYQELQLLGSMPVFQVYGSGQAIPVPVKTKHSADGTVTYWTNLRRGRHREHVSIGTNKQVPAYFRVKVRGKGKWEIASCRPPDTDLRFIAPFSVELSVFGGEKARVKASLIEDSRMFNSVYDHATSSSVNSRVSLDSMDSDEE